MKSLTSKDFAGLFGTTEEEINIFCGDLIKKYEFKYRELSLEERDALILKIIKAIYSENLKQAGENRKNDWETGWSENLNDFINSNYDLSKLAPKYFKSDVPARFGGDFYQTISDNFVLNYYQVFKHWLFNKYLKDYKNIYEFGCGPAYHLCYLNEIFPEKNLFGFDWAESSLKIIDLLREKKKININGSKFDFFHPDYGVDFNPNSCAFTYGALEQVGSDFNDFLDFLLEKKPDLIVNIECINEFYNQDNLVEYLAYEYHSKRNYLNGYYNELLELEKLNRIKIITAHHHKFGNIYNDTANYIIWKIL
ncbi:MAG: hypothetical protein ABSG15_14045 [FCB group bacterium]|jgi:hypothetical protein